jgi:hypothetical protein
MAAFGNQVLVEKAKCLLAEYYRTINPVYPYLPSGCLSSPYGSEFRISLSVSANKFRYIFHGQKIKFNLYFSFVR